MRVRPFCALVLIAALASPAMAQQVVHGENSIFVSPSVKLGWAVKRGTSEAETLVIIRVIASDAAYRAVRVDGVDPFTKDRKEFVAARPFDRETDLAIPRAQFADHPSTEFHFFASADDAVANKPKLTVFYLGVPDTTPEFAGQIEAEAYLEKMLKK
jgi:hypothetical protein